MVALAQRGMSLERARAVGHWVAVQRMELILMGAVWSTPRRESRQASWEAEVESKLCARRKSGAVIAVKFIPGPVAN